MSTEIKMSISEKIAKLKRLVNALVHAALEPEIEQNGCHGWTVMGTRQVDQAAEQADRLLDEIELELFP